MKRRGAGSAVGAMASALATLACCVPAGFLGASGSAAAAAIFQSGRPWLLGLSGVLLLTGFAQVYRARRCHPGPSRLSLVLLAGALLVVLAVVLFPYVISGWLSNMGE